MATSLKQEGHSSAALDETKRAATIRKKSLHQHQIHDLFQKHGPRMPLSARCIRHAVLPAWPAPGARGDSESALSRTPADIDGSTRLSHSELKALLTEVRARKTLPNCLVCPLPSLLETLPLPCVSTAFILEALPLPCVCTAFIIETVLETLPNCLVCPLPSFSRMQHDCHSGVRLGPHSPGASIPRGCSVAMSDSAWRWQGERAGAEAG